MFYYDEHEKMYNEMKMEMEERYKALSSEERKWERQKSLQEASIIEKPTPNNSKKCVVFRYKLLNILLYFEVKI